MVAADHDVLVNGVGINGIAQLRPVLLQMSDSDFPARFLQDLSASAQPQLSSAQDVIAIAAATAMPPVLYQPVQRIVHLAMAQLACDTVGRPRLDPKRVVSAGIVIRRVPRVNGVDQVSAAPSAWMRGADGRFQWTPLGAGQEDQDPDPKQRPQAQSGQPELNRQLAAQALATALTEIFTPAFVAPPDVCTALGRTVVYGLVPTASNEASDTPPAAPRHDPQILAGSLTTLLKAGPHNAPQAGRSVTYVLMSDDYASNHGASDFLTFSTTLRMLANEFGAFETPAQAQSLLNLLNRHVVTFGSGSGATTEPMGDFYKRAYAALVDYDPNSKPPQPLPTLVMPDAWDAFSGSDQDAIVSALSGILQARSSKVLAPRGRYQDASRLYRLRLFFRIKGETPRCPPELAWSEYSDAFRIAAWYEGGGQALAPIPLPDPTQRSFLKNAKPNASFAVPAGLMNSMQNVSMDGLSKGSAGGGPGLQLNWICSFSIPIITICAFFVLNIFLSLLNIVFFWMAFIKICIPFPIPVPGTSSGDEP